MSKRTGHCLCGAVTFETAVEPHFHACHREMCQRWSGSAMMVIEGRGVTATGPVKTYASSPFAIRAWCGHCGSALWIRDNGSDSYEMMPGLFENAADARLKQEVYADQSPPGFAFAGTHERITAAEYEAGNLHHTGDLT